MKIPRRHLSMGLVAAMAAGINWVSASEVVILYPATISGTLSLGSEDPDPEVVTSILSEFYPITGGQAISKTVSATAPGPYPFDLTVNGGDPAAPADDGVSYRPRIYAYLQNSTASQTYLYFHRNTPIVVDNTTTSPSVTVPVSFDYPETRRVNASITVTGGTISSYYIYASASDPVANESYQGRTFGSTSSQSSKTTWIPMIPHGNVNVFGTVYVVNSQGSQSQRSLPSRFVDLSAGDDNVSWMIELNDAGTLEGDIELATSSSSISTLTNYDVVYRGTSSSTSGINGTLAVSASQPHYSISLTPGTYSVYLRAYFSNPAQYAETDPVPVTITTGGITPLSFNHSFGMARVGLNVDGFYEISNLQQAQSVLRSAAGQDANFYGVPSAAFEHTVPVGTWRRGYTYFRIYNQSNPELLNDNRLYRYNYNNPDAPAVAVGASGITSMGTESITLVKSNVYFDVAETPAQKAQGIEVSLSSPRIYAYKDELNPNGSLRRRSQVYSYGSNVATPLSVFTMVAEPGTYTLEARATVNETSTLFSGSTITFGTPVSTPSGEDVEIEISPTQNPNLQVTLNFEEVTSGGITTVVETPLGPEPPEGFKTVCVPDPDYPVDASCPAIYYDITTNAEWDDGQGALVCIRRMFEPPYVASRAAAEFLTLSHYGPNGWEELVEDRSVTDCGVIPADCGCTGPNGCSIPNGSFMFQVCGRTKGFSPFAILQRKPRLTNKVGGVEFTGRNGSGLQQWVVPVSGTYRVTAVGAQGGAATISPSLKGGCGAEVTGDFVLYTGEVLEILVGQKGSATADSGGGGGGTFVNKLGVPPLVIAGGGGGVRSGALVNGRPGTLGSDGRAGSLSPDYTSSFVEGGTGGGGGAFVPGHGGGGGGMWGNGASDAAYGEGGFAFLDDAQGRGGAGTSCGPAADGGYGGGGAGNGCYGGGGGGGYSGGGGGVVGGGGGSYNSGANPTGLEGKCTPSGHGSVTIDLIAGAP